MVLVQRPIPDVMYVNDFSNGSRMDFSDDMTMHYTFILL